MGVMGTGLQGMGFVARKSALCGLDFEQPVKIVLALTPVASVRRLAARPVGAHRRHWTFLARRMSRMALTSVVLPTPCPPVRTSTRLASAWR